jgi:hypothetical protein
LIQFDFLLRLAADVYCKYFVETGIHYGFYFLLVADFIMIYEYPFYCLFFGPNLIGSKVYYYNGDLYGTC